MNKLICLFILFLFQFSFSEIIWKSNISELPNNQLTTETIKSHFDTRYVKGSEENDGFRISVESGELNNGSIGKYIRIKYPKEQNGTKNSGATWETSLNIHTEELFLAFWVKFDENFDFRHGGKLLGLRGSLPPFPGPDPFRIRLMWREEGALEFYLHDYGMLNGEGKTPYRHWWNKGGQRQFIPGKWHHIEIQVRLNTHGLLDGALRGWFDGQLAFEDTNSNVGVRAKDQSERQLNCFFFNTFFGGSSSQIIDGDTIPEEIYWGPTHDVFANFDDISISSSRIGFEKKSLDTNTTQLSVTQSQSSITISRIQNGYLLVSHLPNIRVVVLNINGVEETIHSNCGHLILSNQNLRKGAYLLRINGKYSLITIH